MSSVPQTDQQSTDETYEPRQWTVVVPVKELHLAKSRLGELGESARRHLARAFALDTVVAALGCPEIAQVVVVTNDPVGSLLRERGCVVIPDVPDAGLNPALAFAEEHVRAQRPRAALAAISSDLPSVRAEDLSVALDAAPPQGWFVPDSHGIGTTMLGSPSGAGWRPAFGGASRAAHLERGLVEVDVPGLERLRLDVDTTADLEAARRLGVGAETAGVLEQFESLG